MQFSISWEWVAICCVAYFVASHHATLWLLGKQTKTLGQLIEDVDKWCEENHIQVKSKR